MINPDSYEFMLFVNWLVDEKDFTAKEILDVVYYSHKYEKQMKEYLDENKYESKLERI